jgi:large subunit ribosomal protein L20
MSRVKRGVTSNKRRKNILAQVKGYRFSRSTKERAAREAIAHAGEYQFAHRRTKKRDMRALWSMRINAALRAGGFGSYSVFIGALKKKSVDLDRKVLSQLAATMPETFTRIATAVK